MSAMGMAAQFATILSGIVSLIVILSVVLDYVTSGWIRRWFQRWSGISGLRQDHHTTQTFLTDLGESYNELSEVVCEEHDADDIPQVDANRYRRLLDDDDNLEPGDFLRGGD